jgi:N-methylhydantoinase A
VKISALLAEMMEDGGSFLEKAEIPKDQIEFHIKADMRYLGQKHEITVPLSRTANSEPFETAYLLECFEAEYRRIFGRTYPDIPIEALSWRVVSSGPASTLDATSLLFDKPSHRDQASARRDVVESTGSTVAQWPVYQWNQLPIAKRLSGPALVEDPYTTVVVSSFFDFEMDERCSIHLWEKVAVDDNQR